MSSSEIANHSCKRAIEILSLFLLATQLAFLTPHEATAQNKSPFCQGFEEGYKSVRGGVIVPICPIPPPVPIGSTPFREGLKMGIQKGRSSGQGVSGFAGRGPIDAALGNGREAFCTGFSEGWKSVKGNLTIVPICPIAPITPINSTAFREGIKRGIVEARKR